MGGFNIGELFGALRLDDAQYYQALSRAGGATNLFKVQLEDVTNKGLLGVMEQLNKAGFSLQQFAEWQGKVRDQGYSANAAIKMFSQALEEAQTRARELTRTQIGGSELERFRAMLEAERLRTNELKEQFRIKQDYARLVDRLRGQEQIGVQRNRAGDAEGARQERDYAARAASERTRSETEYSSLVKKLRAEEVAATSAARIKLDNDAKARSAEIQARVRGDAEVALRIAREAQEAQAKVIRDAQTRERAQFIEHRRQMQIASAATTIGMSMAAVGGAGVGAGVFVAKDASQFQDSMAKSLAVIGDLGDAMRDKLSQAARDAAKETGLAAKSIADDYAIAAKGGLDAAQSLEFVPKAAKFAIATNSDLHESTRQIITIMEALQLPAGSASKVMDELTVANQLARGSVDQLATALEGKSGAALRSANVSLEEALALTVAFSKAGVTASQSQTFLTQIIERLTYAARQYGNETVRVGDKQMKFHDIVYQTDGSVRPFIQTLKLLDEAFKGHSSNSIGKFFDDIHLGSARGAQALKILLSQSDVLDTLTTKFGNVGGAMDKAFAQQMQSPLRQLEVLRAKLTDIAIAIGIPTVAALQSFAKAMDPVLGLLQTLAAKFSELPQGMQQFITMSLGIGSASLVAGGGLLVMAGHIVRLRADLLLLNSQSSLGGLIGLLGSATSWFLGLSVVVAATAAAIVDLSGKIEKQKSIDSSGASTNAKIGASILNFIVPSTLVGSSTAEDTISAHRKLVESNKTAADKLLGKIAKVESNQTTDELRKALEEFKVQMRSVLDSSDFSMDPEKVLKKSLKIEDIRQKFAEFSDQYNQIVDRLTGQEQDVISGGAQRLGKLLASGADPRLVIAALNSLEGDLRRFKADAAHRDKLEATAFAKDNATAQVEAFKERYTADLRNFSDEQKRLIEGGISTLQAEAAGGTKPKQIAEDLKLVELAYKSIQNTIDDVDRTQRKLNETERKFAALDRREQKQKPDMSSALEKMNPALAQTVRSLEAVIHKSSQVESAMGNMGITSQGALTRASQLAAMLYSEVKTLNPSTDELRESWLRAREAFIRADEGLKPLHEDFVKVRVEIDRLKSEGDLNDRLIELTTLRIRTEALGISARGVGGIYADLAESFKNSLGSVGETLASAFLDPDKFTKNWKNALHTIEQQLLGSFLQALLKLAASKIIIALGLGQDAPQLVATSKNSVELDINSHETDLNTLAENRNTTATDLNTAALDRLTAALDALGPAKAQQSDPLANFFGGLAGGFFGVKMGGNMPSYDVGGFVPRTGPAMLHAGEYVMTAQNTRGLGAMLASGGGGDIIINMPGSSFGVGMTQAMADSVLKHAVSKLRRTGGLPTPKGRL